MMFRNSLSRHRFAASAVTAVAVLVTVYLWNTWNVTSSSTTEVKRRKREKLQPEYEVEVCLSDIASVRAVQHTSISSVELCCNRKEGGVTPSMGLIEQVVAALADTDISVNVLIRPRPGDFVYSDEEFDVIVRDVTAAVAAGVDGIVFGVLKKDGTVDEPRMRIVRQLCYGLRFTFHRAFDVSTDTVSAGRIENLISMGCDRLLTSGRANTALEGSKVLKELCVLADNASGRLQIVAAAGISSENVVAVIQESGVRAVHAGSSVTSTIFSDISLDNEPSDYSTVLSTGSLESLQILSPSLLSQRRFNPTDMREWTCVQYEFAAQLCTNAHRQWGLLHLEED